MHGAALLSMAMPTVRDAPWPSQPSPKPADCGLPFLIGERRGCSTCSRILVEQRRGPASTVTQVLATASAPVFRPLRFGGQALRRVWVATRPHATRCTAISRPARGRSRTRFKASAACRRVVAGARAAESQRSEQLRAALNEGLSWRASSERGTQVRSRVLARNLLKENDL